MAPRLQVDPIQVRETFQPAEEVINTVYYNPAMKPKSRLHELAESLQSFSNDIGGYMERHQKDNDEAAYVRGQAEALKANGEEYNAGMAEGVASGLFPTFESPQFLEGYKVTQGQIIGKRIASQFATEYQAWDGRNSQDPALFDQFVGDFMRRNLTTDDPLILKGAIPYLQETASAGYTANTQDRSTALYNSSIDTSIASSSMDVDNFIDRGVASGAGVDYDALWSTIMGQRNNALATGVLASDYDDKLIDMIARQALDEADPALLGMLENVVPGETYTYAKSPAGEAKIAATLNAMQSAQAERERAEAAAQKARDEAEKDANMAQAMTQLYLDPSYVFEEEFLVRATALDPKFRLTINEASANFANPQPEDAAQLLAIQAGIITGELDMTDLVNEMTPDGAIHDKATAQSMFNLLNSQKDNANQPLFTNQTYKDAMTLLQRQLTPEASFGEDISVAANAARLDYSRSMVAWFVQNPDADYNAIATQSATVLSRVLGGVDKSNVMEPTYATPQDLLPAEEGGQPAEPAAVDDNGRPLPATGIEPNPLAPSQQELDNEAAAQPADDPFAVWRGETAPAFDQLSPDQQTQIEERARALGETTDNYILQLYGNLRDTAPEATTVDGQPLDQPAPGDQSDVTQYTNNNPGNLRLTAFTRSMGATGEDARGIAIFPDTATGLNAQRTLLFKDERYVNLSLRDAIFKYAPPSENDSQNYVNVVTQISGIDPNTIMGQMTPDQQNKVIGAMIRMEGAATGPTIVGGATLQNASLQTPAPTPAGQMPVGGQVTAKPGPSGRLIVQDPVLTSPQFAAHYAQIKGQANYFSSGRHTIPAGNPATAAWQSTNLKPFSITGANGKKLNLRVYAPAAVAFQGFLADLQATGYPIYNVGSANYRTKRGGSGLSEHSYGTAIDINGELADIDGDHDHDEVSPRNPFSNTLQTDLPENISQLAAKWGLSWGGDWRGKKDAMHFEYTGIPPYQGAAPAVRTAGNNA